MKILFLCTSNKNRSKTAEKVFSEMTPHDVASAGLSAKYCEKEQGVLCTESMLKDADIVYVFEEAHLERIQQHTGSKYTNKIVNLGIDDVYTFMDDSLIELLQSKCADLMSK